MGGGGGEGVCVWGAVRSSGGLLTREFTYWPPGDVPQ